mmetsp:Transcript_29148/g.33682  ORF Transcript_29148/g.33682 Transcript_29148/m.33682 type:complete len:194 (+) Transcript_29148:91-672(+)
MKCFCCDAPRPRIRRRSGVLLYLWAVLLVLVLLCTSGCAEGVYDGEGVGNRASLNLNDTNAPATVLEDSTDIPLNVTPQPSNATSAPLVPLPSPTSALTEQRQMLSYGEFAVLIGVVTIAYYAALVGSSLAVGESVQGLLAPLQLVRAMTLSACDCVAFAIGLRRAVGYDGLEFEDDDEDEGLHNDPSSAATS